MGIKRQRQKIENRLLRDANFLKVMENNPKKYPKPVDFIVTFDVVIVI